VRFCVMLEGQEGVTWDQWLAFAEATERLGFEGLFSSDHYLSVQGARDRGSNDAWTIMAALAARTERLRLGTLVSPSTFRHPAVLAKIGVTVDRISGGRAEIGMGAGWWEDEHRTHGFPFPATAERFARFEEQVEIVHGLLSEDVFSHDGTCYTLEECPFLPKGVQKPHPRLIIGASRARPRAARLVARFADEFNTTGGTPEQVRVRYDRVREAAEAEGRDQTKLTTSLMTWYFVGESDAEWRHRVERARRGDPSAGDFDAYLADLERDCIVGTPERAAERLSEYAASGVERIFLNHELFDDLEMVELLASQMLSKVEG